MRYDIVFRFNQALDLSALSTIPAALHSVTAAIEDCRKAGKNAETDPAVLLLMRHLGSIAANTGADDRTLRHDCLEAVGELRRKPVLNTLALRGVSYDETAKKLFHSEAKRCLRNLADALGYDRCDYDLRSNIAGPAVSGEVTLHSDEIYVQVGCTGYGNGVMYRRCNGRRDYTGDRNNHVGIAALANPGALAARICADLGLPVPHFDDRLVA